MLFEHKLIAQDGLVGHWTFDDQNNLVNATVGDDFVLVGSHTAIAGPDSNSGAINIGVGSHYIVQHNIEPNGGSRVNEFTILMDIRVSQLGRWYTLYQINPLNTDDGEWFFDTLGKMGIRATGYTADPVIIPGRWCRLAIAVKNNSRYDYYMDGELVLNGQPNGVDERFSLSPTILLFADEDQEDNPIDVAEVKIFSRALSDEEIGALGGYDYSDPREKSNPQLLVAYGADQEIICSVDSVTHFDYGLAYPLTFEIEIPWGSADLIGYKKCLKAQEWTQITEKYSSDFYNGIEAVRFDYPAGLAYISAAFGSDSDSIFLKIVNRNNTTLPILYQGICEYYDNRVAVVTSSADDWADSGDQTWYQSDEAFRITCRQFRKHNIWLSCGIITNYCNEATWAHIQTQIDSGYVEACSHSRSHSYGPYDDPVGEISGSKEDIINKLDMPASFKMGDKEYVYTWIAPANYYDDIVNTLVGASDYLVNRRYNMPFDRFADWNYDARYFNTIGISREASPIWEGTTDLNDLNSYFDFVVSEQGIYHVMTHPYFLLEEGFEAAQYAWDHLDYIGNKTNIWYVSLGHLYLYHYLQLNQPEIVSVSQNESKTITDFRLEQNYPNPFNPSTKINFSLPKESNVSLVIYNTLGEEVTRLVDEHLKAGYHMTDFNNSHYSSGIYFYRLQAGGFVEAKKMILLK